MMTKFSNENINIRIWIMWEVWQQLNSINKTNESFVFDDSTHSLKQFHSSEMLLIASSNARLYFLLVITIISLFSSILNANKLVIAL